MRGHFCASNLRPFLRFSPDSPRPLRSEFGSEREQTITVSKPHRIVQSKTATAANRKTRESMPACSNHGAYAGGARDLKTSRAPIQIGKAKMAPKMETTKLS